MERWIDCVMDSSDFSSWRIKNQDPKIALREYRGMLNDLTRLISDWVWETDADYRLTYVSEKILQSLGISIDEALGKKITQFGTFRSKTGEPIQPDFSRPFRDMAFHGENRLGETRNILISGVPVYDLETGDFSGVRGISKDITSDKENKETSEKLRAAIDKFPGIFYLTDPEDRFVLFNRAFAERNKHNSGPEVIGTYLEDYLREVVEKGLVPDAFGKEEEWVTYRMYLHRNPHGSFEVRRENGVVYQISEIKLDDGSTATFSIDITELKRVEGALRQVAERNRIFAMNVGHDLRTPLAVLSANIDNMEDKETAASLRQDLDAMSRSVEQLLDATKWENAEITEADHVDLSKVAQDVVANLAMQAIRARKHLELKGAERPVWVSGLEAPMMIALRNLIENAIQYAPEDTEITIEVEQSGSLKVVDQGSGIPETILKGLIDPHIRSDRRRPNSGLGLSIVQRIAEAHGASLIIKEREGGGTICQLDFTRVE